LVAVFAGVACASESDEIAPSDARDAGSDDAQASEDDAGEGPDAGGDAGEPPRCDLSGEWVSQQQTRQTAIGAVQLATNWSYYRIEQEGTRLTVATNLDCGYVVRGSTDVSLGDAALEAMAKIASHGGGTEGSFELTDDGEGCVLELDRIYTLRGAQMDVLDDVWQLGDAPVELDAFELPANADEGMEDWDDDGHEGITQLTGFGDRYTAQIDWYAYTGEVPRGALDEDVIGGEGVLRVDYDMRESVSAETDALLATSAQPMSPGYVFLVRADGLADDVSGQGAELATCKRAQALAVEKLGNPPQP
jgi:hypothetical protein